MATSRSLESEGRPPDRVRPDNHLNSCSLGVSAVSDSSRRQDLTESRHSACSLHVRKLPMGSHEQRASLSDTGSRSREGWQGLEAPRGGRGVHASWPRPVCRGLAWRSSGRLEGTVSLVVVAPQLLAGRNGRFLTSGGTEVRISLHSQARDLRDFIGPAATPCRSRRCLCV